MTTPTSLMTKEMIGSFGVMCHVCERLLSSASEDDTLDTLIERVKNHRYSEAITLNLRGTPRGEIILALERANLRWKMNKD